MNHSQAIEIAKTPIKPQGQISEKDPYAIPFESANSVKDLVGKTLRNRTNGAEFTITDWVGQNFVMQLGKSDEYKVMPAIYILQISRKLEII